MQQLKTSFLSAKSSFLLLATSLVWTLSMEGAELASRGSAHPVLTRVSEARRLRPREAVQGYPVHFRGVVTYCDPEAELFFIQDSTAGIFVNPEHMSFSGAARDEAAGANRHPVQPGDWVEVEGRTDQVDYAPEITQPAVRVLGAAPMPVPRPIDLAHLTSGEDDSQWVEVHGIVCSAVEQSADRYAAQPWEELLSSNLGPVASSSKRLSLEIMMAGRRIKAHLLHFQPSDISRLVDSRVQIQGVLGTIFTQQGQMIGQQLFIPSPDFIIVEEPAPDDPFGIPVRSIGSLLKFNLEGESGHRVRVEGVVTLQRRGRSLFIRDGTDSVYVQTMQASAVRLGDRVEVVGFPAVGEYTPKLRDAIYRRIGAGTLVKPIPIQPDEALKGTYDAELVQIHAKLLDCVLNSYEQVLTLQAGQWIFNASLESARRLSEAIPNGSEVQLTGICSVQLDEQRRPRAFKILLRSIDDITILKRPSWWTLENALWTFGLMGIIILIGSGWVIVLKQRVRQQTKVIENREELYRSIVETTSEWIWATDSLGMLTYSNPAVQPILGYRPDEIVGNDSLMLLHTEDRDPFEQIRNGQEARKVGWTGLVFRWRHKEGHYCFLESNAVPVLSDDGKFAGYRGSDRNITERKQMEQELAKARDAALESARLKSEFLTNVSHEIRTPMNGIIGMTELALDTDLTSEQREYVGLVKASADSLLTIINDVLDFSKIEAGKLHLDSIPFNLRDSLEETAKTFAVRAHQKGLELICHLEPNVPELVVGDPTRLRQVVVNLLGNAVKFTENGEVVLRVEIESRGNDFATLHFVVADTGIGIPESKQRLVFEAFTQADGSTTRRFGGTGLGLTISSRLVKLMQGRIWVESELGQGSKFHFTAHFSLPLNAPVKIIPANLHSLRGLPVLLVDDNLANLRVLEVMLTHWGMKPIGRSGSRSALQSLEEACNTGAPFPLLLVDAHLPEMDGFSLVDRIQRNPNLGSAPVIMMLSSAGQPGDAIRCRELSIAAYLTKPVRRSELLDAVLTVLGASPSKKPPTTLVTRHSLRENKKILRVLLAEDNLVNQKLTVRLLEKQGHQVEVAGNGREALEALESRFFDLVLMDVQMPEMNGFEVTTAIRNRERIRGGHLPIIAMTAHAMKGDRERCLEAGMDGYVSKPVQVKELFEAMEKAIASFVAGAVATERTTGRAVVTQAQPPEEGAPNPDDLDLGKVLAMVEGDLKLLQELVDLFLNESKQSMIEIQESVQNRDPKLLELAAHKLKGSVSHFSAQGAFMAAVRLEEMGREKDMEHAEEAVAELKQALDELTPTLADWGNRPQA